MKKLGLILFALGLVSVTACNDPKEEPAKDCIHCTGCFSDWDECKDGYRPAEGDTMTWEEHVNYMVNNPSGATWSCTRSN